MGLAKGCQCYLGPFGAKVLFFTLLIILLTTLHNLVTKPLLWRLLLPPAKLELEHDEIIYSMKPERELQIRISTNKSKAAAFGLTVVTAASSNYYSQLVNLIGSVQLWESALPVNIYDVGLTPPQVRELRCLQKVTVTPFPFSKYAAPRDSHILDLKTGSFKPLVVADALERHVKILFLDAGTEMWSNVDFVVEGLQKDGFYFVERPLGGTADGGRWPLGGDQSASNVKTTSKKIISDSVQGYVQHSSGARDILNKLVRCTLHRNCSISMKSDPSSQDGADFPPLNPLRFRGADLETPSPFAALVFRSGLEVAGILLDFKTVKSRPDSKLVFAREMHCPKPYIHNLQYGVCPTSFARDGRDSMPGVMGAPDWAFAPPIQKRVPPCGSFLFGESYISTQTLFKFVFFAEAVAISSVLCLVLRRYVMRSRLIVVEDTQWTKIL